MPALSVYIALSSPEARCVQVDISIPSNDFRPIDVPLMTREAFATATGLPLGVLVAQCDRGYWPQVTKGKRVFINLFRQWWVPKSIGLVLLSLDQDVRVGGAYRLVFDRGDSKTMAFFGKYIEVTPPSRLSWTNEESDDGAVTTVTFEEKDGQTHLTFSELYPTKEALDRNIGSTEGLPEQFAQLDALLPTLG